MSQWLLLSIYMYTNPSEILFLLPESYENRVGIMDSQEQSWFWALQETKIQ